MALALLKNAWSNLNQKKFFSEIGQHPEERSTAHDEGAYDHPILPSHLDYNQSCYLV